MSEETIHQYRGQAIITKAITVWCKFDPATDELTKQIREQHKQDVKAAYKIYRHHQKQYVVGKISQMVLLPESKVRQHLRELGYDFKEPPKKLAQEIMSTILAAMGNREMTIREIVEASDLSVNTVSDRMNRFKDKIFEIAGTVTVPGMKAVTLWRVKARSMFLNSKGKLT